MIRHQPHPHQLHTHPRPRPRPRHRGRYSLGDLACTREARVVLQHLPCQGKSLSRNSKGRNEFSMPW